MLLLLSGIFLSANGFAQELSTDEKQALEKMEKDYAVDKKTASARYAWLLYRTGDEAYYLKADSVLNQFISFQDDELEALTYGQWGWKWENGKKLSISTGLYSKQISCSPSYGISSPKCQPKRR